MAAPPPPLPSLRQCSSRGSASPHPSPLGMSRQRSSRRTSLASLSSPHHSPFSFRQQQRSSRTINTSASPPSPRRRPRRPSIAPEPTPPPTVPRVAPDLLRLLPALLVEQLLRNRPRVCWRDSIDPLRAAFVFVDLLGLHYLVEKIHATSPVEDGGAESRRARVLTSIGESFHTLTAIASKHGGDVVHFTGHTLLLAWPFAETDLNSAEAKRCSVSASRCALELLSLNGLQLLDGAAPAGVGGGGGAMHRLAEIEFGRKLARLRDLSQDDNGFHSLLQGDLFLLPGPLDDEVLELLGPQPDPPQPQQLWLSAGVGVGDLFSAHVGVASRWDFVVWGEALADISRAVQTSAKPGQVLVSQDIFASCSELMSFYSTVPPKASLEERSAALLSLREVNLDAQGVSVGAIHAEREALAASLAEEASAEVLEVQVQHYLGGAEWEGRWRGGEMPTAEHSALAECVVMVLKLRAEYRSQSSLDRTQKAVRLIVRVLQQQQGSYVQFVQTPTGGMAVAAFGLAHLPLSKATSAQRACAAGAELRKKLLQIGVSSCVGLAWGTCATSFVPGERRVAAVLLGKPVALATLLANACTERRPMLMDDICFQANKSNYNSELVRSVHWYGGELRRMPYVKLLLTFALTSMDPVKVDSTSLHKTHHVSKWLLSHGRPIPEHEDQLSQVAMRELRDCFDALDEDSDGVISLTELQEALAHTHVFSETDVVETLFANLGAHRKGRVRFGEFKEALRTTPDADDGKGSLGESVKLVLLAYTSRRQMQRQLGEGFTAKFTTPEGGSGEAQGDKGRLSCGGQLSARLGKQISFKLQPSSVWTTASLRQQSSQQLGATTITKQPTFIRGDSHLTADDKPAATSLWNVMLQYESDLATYREWKAAQPSKVATPRRRLDPLASSGGMDFADDELPTVDGLRPSTAPPSSLVHSACTASDRPHTAYDIQPTDARARAEVFHGAATHRPTVRRPLNNGGPVARGALSARESRLSPWLADIGQPQHRIRVNASLCRNRKPAHFHRIETPRVHSLELDAIPC